MESTSSKPLSKTSTLLRGSGSSSAKHWKNLPEIFSLPLEYSVYLSMYDDGIMVSRVIRDCVTYIEYNGIEEEGLYRKPGLSSKIDAIKKLYNSYQEVDLRHYDIHTVASTLKTYLRDLPDHILTDQGKSDVDSFIQEITINQLEPKSYIVTLKKMLEGLPSCHYETLGWLCLHFKHVSDETRNLMDIHNLAIVLVPTLRFSKNILSVLVENSGVLFSRIVLIRPQSKFLTPYKLYNEIEKYESDLSKINKRIEHNKANEKDYTRVLNITRELEYLKKRMNGIISLKQATNSGGSTGRARRNEPNNQILRNVISQDKTLPPVMSPDEILKIISEFQDDLGIDCQNLLTQNKLELHHNDNPLPKTRHIDVDNKRSLAKRLWRTAKTQSLAELKNEHIDISSVRRLRKEQNNNIDDSETQQRKILNCVSRNIDPSLFTFQTSDNIPINEVAASDVTKLDSMENLQMSLNDSIGNSDLLLDTKLLYDNSLNDKIKDILAKDFDIFLKLKRENEKLHSNITRLNDFITLETDIIEPIKKKINKQLKLTGAVFKYFVEQGINIDNQDTLAKVDDDKQKLNIFLDEIVAKNKIRKNVPCIQNNMFNVYTS